MADETPTVAAAAAEAVLAPVQVPSQMTHKDTSPPPESFSVTETQTPLPPPQQESPPVEVIEPVDKPVEVESKKKVPPESLISFKEESNRLADLSDFERRALDELKQLVRKAIDDREFSSESCDEISGEPSIWGVPILKDDRSDVILLKFLRARDFKVKDAFTMLKNTLKWRKDFGIDGLIQEELGDDLEKVVLRTYLFSSLVLYYIILIILL